MALTPKFNVAQVIGQVKVSQQALTQAMINRLKRVGDQFVTNARNNHTYTDRTGNLTSSIGYIILKDGEQLFEDFTGGDQTAGRSKGKSVAVAAAEKFAKGLVLIVVAGMEYAAAVESKNFDVITASSITSENDLKKSLEELRKKVT